MSSPWTELLAAGCCSNLDSGNPQFPETSPSQKDLECEETIDEEGLERELRTYLEFCKEGKSLMMNLKKRKEFYRLDLFEHLYSGTMSKMLTEEGEAGGGLLARVGCEGNELN